MAMICYHASHEQFAPSVLRDYAMRAERAGFDGIHSSDHFHPWSERQGQSGFSFSWIAAALQATSLPFSMVCAPGQRYHPAIVAQALATLAELFPGRVDVELGSGEALNECITGEEWPDKKSRNQRLLECAVIIRRLFAGETVTHEGLVKVIEAKLFSLPAQTPRLFCAAISSETAAWAGSWADGLLTTADKDIKMLRNKIDGFQQAGTVKKPVFLQYAFSYGRDRRQAEAGAHDQWRSNILPREKLANYRTVAQFDAAGRDVTPQEVQEVIPVFTDMEQLMEQVNALNLPEVERIILHNINRPHIEFIEDYGRLKNSVGR